MEKTEDKKKIVFVCAGNTCRSPMAEAVFASELKRRKIDDAEGCSAGISAKGNGAENINLKSASTLAENGLSVENFHARKLDEEILKNAFAFVCMTDEQRDYVMELRWNALRKTREEEIVNNVFSFSEICGYEIPDPYGGDVELYRKTFSLINAAMPALFERFFPATKKEEQPQKRKRGRPKKSETNAAATKKSTTEKKRTTKTKKGKKE